MTEPNGPPTVADLKREGRGILAECQDCGHTVMLSKEAMQRLDPAMPVPDVKKRLRCSCCNSKLILTRGQSDRDAKRGRAR